MRVLCSEVATSIEIFKFLSAQRLTIESKCTTKQAYFCKAKMSNIKKPQLDCLLLKSTLIATSAKNTAMKSRIMNDGHNMYHHTFFFPSISLPNSYNCQEHHNEKVLQKVSAVARGMMTQSQILEFKAEYKCALPRGN